jgi:SAM-dependent methyltransferase
MNRQFHDQVEAHSYDQRMGVCHDQTDVQRTLDELERVLGQPLPAGGTVLDLGAGTGNLAIKLALDGRFQRVIAVDISAGMLREAAQAAAARGVRLETVVSDMRPLPFASGSVDLVVGCAVLHHVPEVDALMAEVRRVLKPGAPCVFVGEPSTWGARLTSLVKLPLVLGARLYGLVTKRERPRWDHDEIDVHTFSTADLRGLAKDRFAELRLCPEGFFEPIVDQALLAPLGLVLGEHQILASSSRALRRYLTRLDQRVVPLLPEDLRVSMKFSCRANPLDLLS